MAGPQVREKAGSVACVRCTIGLLREKFVELPMKRPSLCSLVVAATLFLDVGLWAEEGKAEAPVSAPDQAAEQAVKRSTPTVANEGDRRQALRTELIKLFDKNGDGKLNEGEMAAVSEFLLKGRIPPGAILSPAQEQARLVAVAVEVARRRRLREEATAAIGNPRTAPAPEQLEEAIRRARADVTRLEKLAAEIALRRVEREKAQPAGERK
jgi:hypothetical protein